MDLPLCELLNRPRNLLRRHLLTMPFDDVRQFLPAAFGIIGIVRVAYGNPTVQGTPHATGFQQSRLEFEYQGRHPTECPIDGPRLNRGGCDLFGIGRDGVVGD